MGAVLLELAVLATGLVVWFIGIPLVVGWLCLRLLGPDPSVIMRESLFGEDRLSSEGTAAAVGAVMIATIPALGVGVLTNWNGFAVFLFIFLVALLVGLWSHWANQREHAGRAAGPRALYHATRQWPMRRRIRRRVHKALRNQQAVFDANQLYTDVMGDYLKKRKGR